MSYNPLTYRGYTDEQLSCLVKLSNHKAEFLGDGYYWKSFNGLEWETRLSDSPKNTSKDVYSFVYYAIGKWTKEIKNREMDTDKTRDFYDNAAKSEIIWYIKINAKLSLKDKVREILNVDSTITVDELAELLNSSRSTIYRNL